MQLPYYPEIPLLSTDTKKTKVLIWKNICTPKFFAALFTKAGIGKEPKYSSIDEWMEKMWYMYMQGNIYVAYVYARKYICGICICKEILLSHKKNGILPFSTTWMNLDGIMLSEVKERKISWFRSYVDLEIRTNVQTQQNRNRLIDTENKLVVTRGKGVGVRASR